MSKSDVSRREFLRRSAVAAGGFALLGGGALTGARAQENNSSPNERIGVAVIGCGGMGNAHIGAIQRLKSEGYPVEIVAVCDVYQPRLEAAAERTGGEPYKDYRKVLEREDVDCVSIATPDHWHSRIAVDAADAGKDVYCEKPMTHWRDLKEAQDIVEAIARNKRVMQVGTQGMSDSIWEQVRKAIAGGAVGQLIHAQASDMRNGHIGVYDPNSNDGKADPATNLDWDMWLGPAKKRPYEPGRFFAFRSFWDYSGGVGTDFFPHILTPLVTAMGLEFPKRATASGGLYQLKDGRDIPDIYNLVIEYPNGPSLLLVGAVANNTGLPMQIRGYKGTVAFEGPGAVIHPQPGGGEKREITRESGASLEKHFRDLFECMRTRRKPVSNEVKGYQVMTALHMGIHSYLKGRAMEFDPATGKTKFL